MAETARLGITAEITGHMPKTHFDSFSEAGASLWAVLRSLPLGHVQASAYRHLLTDAADQLGPLFQHRATVHLTFELDRGTRHTVTITRRP
ncbi:hypothetical protein ACFV1L_18325 [Kitasatospora sp. NPDC059646]|uniref:hypothetical protein n=1 Tax=Kitasatospora sp. NPDC059646 TaxID=3346893 RepID=UPI003697DF93